MHLGTSSWGGTCSTAEALVGRFFEVADVAAALLGALHQGVVDLVCAPSP